MDSSTATQILTDPTLTLPASSEKDIRDAAKTVFLDDYDRLVELDPMLEEKVFRVKGLMSELFTHRKKKIKKQSRRRQSSI
jgi:hypothetical protein